MFSNFIGNVMANIIVEHINPLTPPTTAFFWFVTKKRKKHPKAGKKEDEMLYKNVVHTILHYMSKHSKTQNLTQT